MGQRQRTHRTRALRPLLVFAVLGLSATACGSGDNGGADDGSRARSCVTDGPATPATGEVPAAKGVTEEVPQSLVLHDLDRGEPTELVSPEALGARVTGLSWYPDGTRVAVATDRLLAVNVESGALTVLFEPTGQIQSAEVSPDGQRVAFAAQFGDAWDICVVPAAGGDARRITDDEPQDFALGWVDDRHLLYLQSRPNSEGSDAFVIDVTNGQREAATTQQRDQSSPDQSPGGDWTFVRFPTKEPSQFPSGLAAKLRGPKGRVITLAAWDLTPGQHAENEFQVSWSNNDTAVVTRFTTVSDAGEIRSTRMMAWVIDLQSKAVMPIVDLPAHGFEPSAFVELSPDGGRIALVSATTSN